MSVFSFSKTDEVWGLNNRLTSSMIEWWIGQVGPKPYLLMIQTSYNHGINHGDLTEVSDYDKAELRDLVRLMLEIGFEINLVSDPAHAPDVRRYIADLHRLIEIDLEGTPFHSSVRKP